MAAFAVFSYVVIRHLARVELWDSTRLVVRGLHRPAPRVLAVLLYPPIDVLLLCAAFAVVAVLVRAEAGFEHARSLWRQMAPVGVGIPFLGIACSSAYRRVWSRARVAEYGILLVWLMGGILLACVALELLYALPTTTMLTALFVYLGAALPGILLARTAAPIAGHASASEAPSGARPDCRWRAAVWRRLYGDAFPPAAHLRGYRRRRAVPGSRIHR